MVLHGHVEALDRMMIEDLVPIGADADGQKLNMAVVVSMVDVMVKRDAETVTEKATLDEVAQIADREQNEDGMVARVVNTLGRDADHDHVLSLLYVVGQMVTAEACHEADKEASVLHRGWL